MPNMMPLDSDRAMDTHQLRLRNLGYTLTENALPPDLLRTLRARFDELLPKHGELPTAARPDTPSRDMNHLCEIEPLFDQLITLPSVFPIAELYMNGDVELLACTIGNFMPAHTPARVPWHRDGDYVRLTYLLSDVESHGGPTAVLPGTHREEEGPPKWLNTDDGYPRAVPGMVKIAAKAGTCMVNDTRIWHSSTPNDSDSDRKLVWIVLKTRAQSITSFENLRHRQSYIDRQTDPTMRRLLGLPTTIPTN